MNDTSMSTKNIIDQLVETREKIKFLKKKEEFFQKKILEKMESEELRSISGDENIVYLVTSMRTGTIDIQQMKNDGINIEKYRRPPKPTKTLRTERREISFE